MRRVAFCLSFVVFCGACILFFGGSATTPETAAQERSIRFDHSADDRELAGSIRRMTHRTSDPAKQTVTENGIMMDLSDGFLNVALAKIARAGDVETMCIDNIDAANDFFERDLETGEAFPARETRTRKQIAADHGMSVNEYDFYTKLIKDAEARREAFPDLATINIINNNAAGVGFNDPSAAFVVGEGGNNGTTRGAQRLNVFNRAAQIWGAFLDSSVPINVRAQMTSQTCTPQGAVLGSAGPINIHRDFSSAPYANTWYYAALANKLSGSDLNTANPDINTNFNMDIDTGCLAANSRWYYGYDNAVPNLRINLLVVVLHELGHGLGFSTQTSGSTGAYNGGFPDIWNRFMLDTNTGLYWNDPTMTNAQRQASALSNGALRWDGANVKIASGYLTAGRDAQNRVHLYAPTTFQGGSSVSHYSTLAAPNLLMEPSINNGLGIDGDLTRQLFRDIGWYRDTTGDRVPDTITNVYPSGGNLQIGSSTIIAWNNTGSFSRNVTIELSTDGGLTYPTVIASNVANTGVYRGVDAWLVPNTPTTTAKIRVRETDFVEPAGVSVQNFSISAAPTAANASISGRVFDHSGNPLNRVTVRFTSTDGTVHSAISNSFGYYAIDGLNGGSVYVATADHKRFSFEPRSVTLNENLVGFDFTANK